MNESKKRNAGPYYSKLKYTEYPKPWVFNTYLSRRDTVNISLLRSNYYALTDSLGRVNFANSCPRGGEAEDINHVVWD